MPLARIFTHHPERTTVLSEQLQQQGYRVEVLSPAVANLAPADLEIEFDICERADVLERAASLADELQAEVAVAPGVLEAEPALAEAPAALTAQESDREREFEAAFEPVEAKIGHAWEPAGHADLASEEPQPQVMEIPVMEQAPLPPVALVEEPPMMKVEPEHEPVPYLAQLTPFGTPHEHAQAVESAQRFSDREPEPAEQKPAGPGLGKRTADFLGKSMAAMKVGMAETAESFREHLKEYKKLAQVRSAEARAARVARMLDLEQRQAEAQQRSAELEAAREVAAARLVELLRQRDPGLHEESLREQALREELRREEELHQASRQARRAEALPTRKLWEALRHLSIASFLRKPRQPMSPQLRAVLTGAAAVTVLFVIGIILGSLYPRAPLAGTTTRPSSSAGVTVQNGSVPVQNSGVTVQTGGVTVKAGTTAQQAQPAPASTATTSQGSATEVKPSPRVAQTRRQVAQQSEDEIGDDVVVRHFSRPAPTQKPKQSGQQAGLKHFSDLDSN